MLLIGFTSLAGLIICTTNFAYFWENLIWNFLKKFLKSNWCISENKKIIEKRLGISVAGWLIRISLGNVTVIGLIRRLHVLYLLICFLKCSNWVSLIFFLFIYFICKLLQFEAFVVWSFYCDKEKNCYATTVSVIV